MSYNKTYQLPTVQPGGTGNDYPILHDKIDKQKPLIQTRSLEHGTPYIGTIVEIQISEKIVQKFGWQDFVSREDLGKMKQYKSALCLLNIQVSGRARGVVLTPEHKLAMAKPAARVVMPYDYLWEEEFIAQYFTKPKVWKNKAVDLHLFIDYWNGEYPEPISEYLKQSEILMGIK